MKLDTPRSMTGPAFVPNAETAAYTAPGGVDAAIVKTIHLVNTSANAAVAVGISVLRGGAAASATNRIVPDALTLDPGAVLTFDVGIVLAPGDQLSWKASLPNVATGTISGYERTTV